MTSITEKDKYPLHFIEWIYRDKVNEIYQYFLEQEKSEHKKSFGCDLIQSRQPCYEMAVEFVFSEYVTDIPEQTFIHAHTQAYLAVEDQMHGGLGVRF
jgi:hypothetical protein